MDYKTDWDFGRGTFKKRREGALNIALTSETLAAAQMLAKRKGISLSDWVRGLIVAEVNKIVLHSIWEDEDDEDD